MTTEEGKKRLKAMAGAIKKKAAAGGMIVLVRDQEGRAHVIPGARVEVIAVYDDRAETSWICDDMIDAGIDR